MQSWIVRMASKQKLIVKIVAASRRIWPTRTFLSFKPHLKALCKEFRPKTALEFGPGHTTRVILKHSEASIVAIEEYVDWYEKYKACFPESRVTVLHKEPNWDLTELDALGGPYDLIIVDAGDRVAEMKYSEKLLTDNGIVYAHDAHEEQYEDGIKSYPFYFYPERHSCIMCKTPEVLEKIKRAITPNYTCRCQYCNTPSRNEHLDRMIANQS